MPLIPNNTVAITNQVLPNGQQPYVNQMNVAQMIGQVQAWNPDLSAARILALLNNTARKLYDRKTWFGLFVKGQVTSPQISNGGRVTLTKGSPTVTGVGTAWTEDVVGQQFRVGYNTPLYTIIDMDPQGQTLTLELPWGFSSSTSGYFIAQYYYNFGPNIKYVKTLLNMQMGIKFTLHATQDTLNSFDPWRQAQNFPWLAAGMPAAADGSYLLEMYPAPTIPQAFPFMAYIQPPNLVQDNDNLPPYIRGDIVIKDVIADALVIGGPRKNAYYDAAESQRKRAEFEGETLRMSNTDENLYRTELTKFGEDMPYFQVGGATWNAQHAVSAGTGWYDL